MKYNGLAYEIVIYALQFNSRNIWRLKYIIYCGIQFILRIFLIVEVLGYESMTEQISWTLRNNCCPHNWISDLALFGIFCSGRLECKTFETETGVWDLAFEIIKDWTILLDISITIIEMIISRNIVINWLLWISKIESLWRDLIRF